MFASENLQPGQGEARAFRTTHWSLILSAQPGSPFAREALEELYRRYQYPVYLYIRRKGHTHHDAQDITQDLFSSLIRNESLEKVSRDSGRFRTFLMACADNCLSNRRQKLKAVKHGGEFLFVSWNEENTEDRYAHETSDGMTPEMAFDWRWAMTVLDNAAKSLEADFVRAKKSAMFDELKIFLSGEKHPASYAEVAARLKMSEPTLRVAITRFRESYGKCIRREIAHTVSDPNQVNDELRYLISVVGKKQK